PRTGPTRPQPPSATRIPVGETTSVPLTLTNGPISDPRQGRPGGATGIAERVTSDVAGFWGNAHATLAASGPAGLSASAPVDSRGVAVLSLTPTQSGPIYLTLTSLDGAAVRATSQAPDGRLLDIPLSVRCATSASFCPSPSRS